MSYRIRYLSLALAVAWAGVIFILSSQPGTYVPLLFAGQDKLLHALVFSVLGFLALGAMKPAGRGYTWIQFVLAIALTGAYGVLDEVHQHFVPGRVTDIYDALADITGAILGTGVLYVLNRWRYRG